MIARCNQRSFQNGLSMALQPQAWGGCTATLAAYAYPSQNPVPHKPDFKACQAAGPWLPASLPQASPTGAKLNLSHLCHPSPSASVRGRIKNLEFQGGRRSCTGANRQQQAELQPGRQSLALESWTSSLPEPPSLFGLRKMEIGWAKAKSSCP